MAVQTVRAAEVRRHDPAGEGPRAGAFGLLGAADPGGRRRVSSRLDDFYCAVCGESTLAGGGCRRHEG